jgi:hypothetical protein
VVDFSLFGSDGYLKAQDSIAGERYKQAEAFANFQKANPYATVDQYQSYLNQIMPNKWTRGPGYGDDLLRQMAEENARKKSIYDQGQQAELYEKQFKNEASANNLFDSVVNDALNGLGPEATTEQLRAEIQKRAKSLNPAMQPIVGERLASTDLDQRLNAFRQNKVIDLKGKVEAASSLLSGLDDPSEMEKILSANGFTDKNVAKAAIEKQQDATNTVRATKLIELRKGLVDPLNKSTQEAITGNQDLQAYVIEQAKVAGIKNPTPDELKRIADDLGNYKNTINADRKNAALAAFRATPALQGLIGNEDKAQIEALAKEALANAQAPQSPENIAAFVRDAMDQKALIAQKSFAAEGTSQKQLLSASVDKQTNDNVAEFKAAIHIAKTQDEKNIYTIAEAVAGKGAYASAAQIDNAVRQVYERDKSRPIPAITEEVFAKFPNNQSVVNQRGAEVNPPSMAKFTTDTQTQLSKIGEDVRGVLKWSADWKDGKKPTLSDGRVPTRTELQGTIADLQFTIAKQINNIKTVNQYSNLAKTDLDASSRNGYKDELEQLTALERQLRVAQTAFAKDYATDNAVNAARAAAEGRDPRVDEQKIVAEIANETDPTKLKNLALKLQQVRTEKDPRGLQSDAQAASVQLQDFHAIDPSIAKIKLKQTAKQIADKYNLDPTTVERQLESQMNESIRLGKNR